MVGKRRADVLCVVAELYPSRARAAEEIRAGHVSADGQLIAKPSALLDPSVVLEVTGVKIPYVSRGGLKLAHALDHFKVDVGERPCLDIGASTGGFTQVLLERGAAHVFAVDVGSGQLAGIVAKDPRVTTLENTDARKLTSEQIGKPHIITADVSFISLTKALTTVLDLAGVGTRLVALIKPQFEVGKKNVASGGIVRDPVLHQKACDDVANWLVAMGWTLHGVTDSPVEGGGGNKEFLIAATKT